jgi:hypothetical protein
MCWGHRGTGGPNPCCGGGAAAARCCWGSAAGRPTRGPDPSAKPGQAAAGPGRRPPAVLRARLSCFLFISHAACCCACRVTLRWYVDTCKAQQRSAPAERDTAARHAGAQGPAGAARRRASGPASLPGPQLGCSAAGTCSGCRGAGADGGSARRRTFCCSSTMSSTHSIMASMFCDRKGAMERSSRSKSDCAARVSGSYSATQAWMRVGLCTC